MLPNNPNFSNYSDLAFYSLQQRAPLLHDQITLESQPQQKEMAPTEAAYTVANTSQQRKRTYRSDRHSKIRTAQGERDRRMRLSVKVAHEFFALQDKLGFDKASQTIDWLLTKAKDSIDQLSSSSSEHTNEEILTDHTIITDQLSQPHYHEPHATLVLQNPNQVGECQLKAKDLRIKARARARERVRGKKVVSGQQDQLVMAADFSVNAPLDGNCNGMEYYYDLLNEIMNGGFCSVDIDELEGTTSARAQFFN